MAEGRRAAVAAAAGAWRPQGPPQNMILQHFVEQIIDDLVCLDRVQLRFEEQDLETPASEVWRGCGGAVLLRDHHSHLETWPSFLRAPLLADTRPRVMRQSTIVFVRISCVFPREGAYES